MKTVRVIPYDPAWSTAFENIRAELQVALGKTASAIEHVGSTSVPGLSAKPIIDIDVILRAASDLPEVIDRLASIGYRYEGDLGIPGREAFRYDGKPHLQQHHLYVCAPDSAELRRHLVFRDYLRTHPDAAAQYGAVKMEAARLFPNDMDGYIAYKAPCILQLYAACGLTGEKPQQEKEQPI